jgi:hypothetical protein
MTPHISETGPVPISLLAYKLWALRDSTKCKMRKWILFMLRLIYSVGAGAGKAGERAGFFYGAVAMGAFDRAGGGRECQQPIVLSTALSTDLLTFHALRKSNDAR